MTRLSAGVGALALLLSVAAPLLLHGSPGRPVLAQAISGAAMSFRVKSGALTCDAPSEPARCSVRVGENFTLSVAAAVIPPGGYLAFQARVNWPAGLVAQGPIDDDVVWPECGFPAVAGDTGAGPSSVLYGCAVGPGDGPSSFTGHLVEIVFSCGQEGSHKVLMPAGEPLDSFYADAATIAVVPDATPQDGVRAADSIVIDCVASPLTEAPVQPTGEPASGGAVLADTRAEDGDGFPLGTLLVSLIAGLAVIGVAAAFYWRYRWST